MFKKFLIISMVICCSCCKSNQKVYNPVDNITQRCFIIEENFDSTSMKIFLESTKKNREIINKFLKDDSELSFLSIINDKTMFAKKENSQWKIFKRNNTSTIDDVTILYKVKEYANLNIVYKFGCPENYGVFGSNNGFQAFWIKKAGKITFLYYSTTYDINKLNIVDKQKVIGLIEINELFENENNNNREK